MSNLKTLQGRAEAAAERFEEGQSRLYRKDGEPKYGEAETRERLAALREERDAVLVPVTDEANRMMWGASEKLTRAQNADPATLLTDEELAAANARRDFANDFAGSAGPDALAARLDSVLASGDKPNVFAWWQAGDRRRREILRTRQENSTGRASKGTDLDESLEGMRTFLGGERLDAQAKRIREEEQEAMRVAALAGRLQDGVRTAAEAGAARRMARFRVAG